VVNLRPVRWAAQLGILLAAAALEVGGDAVIRAGLRGRTAVLILVGFATLGSYGILLNLLPLDFSRLLGGYVAFFALASIVFGALVFGEPLPVSTWIGLAVILLGSGIIQFGGRVVRP
jgi:drug/metabolite transporter superfamily protein YnfA